jgi:hypothetical protein
LVVLTLSGILKLGLKKSKKSKSRIRPTATCYILFFVILLNLFHLFKGQLTKITMMKRILVPCVLVLGSQQLRVLKISNCDPKPQIDNACPKVKSKGYSTWNGFAASVTDCTKDIVDNYNLHYRMVTKSTKDTAALDILSVLYKSIGFLGVSALVALLAGGIAYYYGGIFAVLLSNPVFAVGLSISIGCAVVILWEDREVVTAVHSAVKSYEDDFHDCLKKHGTNEKDLKQCVDYIHCEAVKKALEAAYHVSLVINEKPINK